MRDRKTIRNTPYGRSLLRVVPCAAMCLSLSIFGCLPGLAQHANSRPPVVRSSPPPQSNQSNQTKGATSPSGSQGQTSRPPVYRGNQPVSPARGNQSVPTVRSNPQPRVFTPSQAPPTPGHLGSWMQQHQNLNPQEQQRALEREPGFNQLPPEQQARMRARLQELNQMPPQQRAQVLNRIEGMERLSPEQRQQVTSTMAQFRALPPGQKQAVARAFGSIRQLPPEQREAAARSYAAQMNPQQREAFNSLVRTEPYLPIQRPQGYPPPPPPIP